MGFVHSVLFYIIHILTGLWQWILLVSKTNCNKLCKKIGKCPDLREIVTDGSRLTKRPSHMGIVIVENQFFYDTIANIVMWCLAYRIRYISIYDSQGVVKSQRRRLLLLLNDHKSAYSEVCDSNIGIKIGDGSLKNGYVGNCEGRQVDVSLLSHDDGRGDIMRAVRAMAEESCAGHMRPESINKDVLSKYLRTTVDWPDPELVIKFGRVSSVMGYLPWQMRVTEILSVDTMESFRYCHFRSLMYKFAKIEQRFGK